MMQLACASNPNVYDDHIGKLTHYNSHTAENKGRILPTVKHSEVTTSKVSSVTPKITSITSKVSSIASSIAAIIYISVRKYSLI